MSKKKRRPFEQLSPEEQAKRRKEAAKLYREGKAKLLAKKGKAVAG